MTIRVLVGDVRERLRSLPADSFDCVVTSPPYWGLRDYGMDGQIGLEPTLGDHLTVMVDVFREVRRVLKPSGTLWLNYGDAYAGSYGAQSREHAGKHAPNVSALSANQVKAAQRRTKTGSLDRTPGLKPKDLMMIPNRLAIALQEEGWWVRSEIIWAKPNPMPESIKDRPAVAHEKIFLLSKSQRYFYNADEVRQGRTGDEDANTFRGGSYVGGRPGPRKVRGNKQAATAASAGAAGASSGSRMAGFNERWDAKEKQRAADVAGPRHMGHINHTGIDSTPRGSRSLRNWEPAPLPAWIMGTSPFSDAHFATFPPELAERCLKAGCPAGGTVLDPFGGAGTTALVADQMQMDATIIEINPDYVHIAVTRIEADRGALENARDPILFDWAGEAA